MKRNDITGKRFGLLTITEHIGRNKHGHSAYSAICDCGNKWQGTYGSLTKKKKPTKSCGCWGRQTGKLTKTHGLASVESKYPPYLYNLWRGAINRCRPISEGGDVRYGGRGITFFEGWKTHPESFFDYILTNLGERPPGHSLDRIDNDRGYEPGNIRWANQTTQGNNTRKARKINQYDSEGNLLQTFPSQAMANRANGWDTHDRRIMTHIRNGTPSIYGFTFKYVEN